jgi:hypothetical protein
MLSQEKRAAGSTTPASRLCKCSEIRAHSESGYEAHQFIIKCSRLKVSQYYSIAFLFTPVELSPANFVTLPMIAVKDDPYTSRFVSRIALPANVQ